MTEWMPAILALFGSLLVVLFSAWLNTRALSIQMEAMDKKLTALIEAMDQKLTAQMERGFAELRLEFHKEIAELVRRVERLEESRGLVRA